MKKIISVSRLFVLAAVLSALSVSCERRPMYIEGKTPVPAYVAMDWKYLGVDPEGATICLYPEPASGSGAYIFRTNSVRLCAVNVPAGDYTVLVFNKTVDEFGTVNISGIDALSSGRADLIYNYTSWTGEDCNTVGQPEAVVCGLTPNYHVNGITSDIPSDTCLVTPTPLNYTGTARVRIKGIQNLDYARAYITGFSQGMQLAGHAQLDTKAVFVLEGWTVNRSDEDYTMGNIEINFSCFGLQRDVSRPSQKSDNRFVIQTTLVDGTTKLEFDLDVGDLIAQNDEESTVTIEIGFNAREGDDPIELPDVEPKGGQKNGFDVTVNDWGDEEDYIIPM